MASLFGWWRALLALIQAKQETRWVEPSNEITRAILSGHVPELAPRQVRVAPASAAPMAASKTTFVPAPLADMPGPLAAEPAAAAIEEAPAAAEGPARSRRRRSHRAA